MAGRQAARRVALTGPVTVTGTLGVGAGAAGSWLPLPVGALPDARTRPAHNRSSSVTGRARSEGRNSAPR